MEVYKTKLKMCGNIIKVHQYEKSIIRGYTSKRNISHENSGQANISEEEREQRRIKKMFRSKSDFTDIINNNFTTKDTFITLTYDKEEDHEVMKYNFNNFIKKLKYRFGKDIKYCYIKFKQQRGVYHYHIVTDIKFIDNDILKKLWKYGYSDISKIKNVNAISTYMANHINKETIDKKEYREKVFQKSRTCEIPKWVYGDDAENILYTISSDYKEKFNRKYDTEMYGEMDIIIYEK
ncbi:MAG: rolling circle replication-associated protein [Paraclostridium sp.]